MINSFEHRSKNLKCPKHHIVKQNFSIYYEITSLFITQKFSIKNQVFSENCQKDKSTYPNWTPLEDIEKLVKNITECQKIAKSNVIKVITKVKQDIIQDLELLESKISEIQVNFDHIIQEYIFNIARFNQKDKLVRNIRFIRNLSYLTLYSQFKNANKSQLLREQFQLIFNQLASARKQIKQIYESESTDDKLLFNSTPVKIEAHDFEINSIVITSDCSKVITTSSEGKLRILGTSTNTEISYISDNFDYAFCVDVTDDDQYIAVCGSNDQIIKVWNINDTSEPLFRLKYHTKTVERIKFVPQSSQLISISQDHQVIIWHETKPEPSRILKYHNSSVKRIAISNNCKLMATSARDKQLIIWNIQNNLLIVHQVQPHKTTCNCIQFSKDLKYMVSGGEDGIIKLWKVQNWNPFQNSQDIHHLYGMCISLIILIQFYHLQPKIFQFRIYHQNHNNKFQYLTRLLPKLLFFKQPLIIMYRIIEW